MFSISINPECEDADQGAPEDEAGNHEASQGDVGTRGFFIHSGLWGCAFLDPTAFPQLGKLFLAHVRDDVFNREAGFGFE
jgi:hypothetical protein